MRWISRSWSTRPARWVHSWLVDLDTDEWIDPTVAGRHYHLSAYDGRPAYYFGFQVEYD